MRTLAGVAVLSLLLPIPSAPLQAQTKSDRTLQSATPRVFLLDARHLSERRTRILAGDKSVAAAIQKLESDAHKALETGPFSVVTKQTTPPSGDKHDYMSQAPYFWPDPKTSDGLPYIRRDGERNLEINKISDHRSLGQMVASVETLALAYYFKGNEAYAVKAVQLLRTFFLDPATRMNPNLQFAQAIPGVNTGRGIGLIETRGLTRVVDAVGLLSGSKALTKIDHRGFEVWFGKFLRWMIEGKNGRDEAAARNNHGTYYDLHEVLLSELDPVRQTAGWRQAEFNRNSNGGGLSVGGRHFDKGIGMPTNSEIEYELNGTYEKFTALVGVDDEHNNKDSVVNFVVIGDGEELWRSGGMKKSDVPKSVKVEVKNVRRLMLRVNREGEGGRVHADWVDVKLVK